MIKFLIEVFTDANGRPEIKMILGVPIIIIAVFYGIFSSVIMNSPDWTGFGALSGLGLALIGTTAVADSLIDRNNYPASSKREM